MVGVSAVLAQRLSRLVIDVDKDWGGRLILNLAGITSPGDLIISPPKDMSVLIGQNDGIRALWLTGEGEAAPTNPIRNSGELKIMGRYWTGAKADYFGFILKTILESAAPYGRLSIITQLGEVMRIYPDKIDMLNKPIKNLANPIDPQDAVTKSYVDPAVNWVNSFKARLRTSSVSTSGDSNIDYIMFVSPLSLNISTDYNAVIVLSATGLIDFKQFDVIDVRIARNNSDICYSHSNHDTSGELTLGFNATCIDSVGRGSYTYTLRLKAFYAIERLKAGAKLTALIIETPP